MLSAAIGEVFACIIRVPTEVIKQRLQVGMHKNVRNVVQDILKSDGKIGFYNGFGATIMREIPFSFIQFPLYELLKSSIVVYSKRDVAAYEAAACIKHFRKEKYLLKKSIQLDICNCNVIFMVVGGSITGAIAAALTTPLDVIKTRLMLGKV